MAEWAKLLDCARAVVEGAAVPECARFLAGWPGSAAARAVRSEPLAVLCWLDAAVDGAPAGPLAALAREVRAAAPRLAWRQTYRAGHVSAAFLARYGWCEIAGATGPVPCASLAAGLLLLGPHTDYPVHGHVAEELYIPLSGAAAWQRGDGAFSVRQPGEAIHHASDEPHAMRTGAAPLLALYLWRGEGLGASARLRHGAPRAPG